MVVVEATTSVITIHVVVAASSIMTCRVRASTASVRARRGRPGLVVGTAQGSVTRRRQFTAAIFALYGH